MMELKNIAILIDADNADVKLIGSIIETLSLHGNITTKRAYGNWKKECLKPWEDVCVKYAINSIQQYDYVSGKNASDFALVIDAMNMLYSDRYDGMAIVSSDSDFTPLLIELREHAIETIGFGKGTTPESFKNACCTFYSIDDMKRTATAAKKNSENLNQLDQWLESAWDEYKDDSGFAALSDAGSFIHRVKPDFKVKTFGCKLLSEYVSKKNSLYEIKTHGNLIYYRIK